MEEELRKKFNPEGSTLRRQQIIMLDMLKVIDDICNRNDIKYWLSSGTLLGAVRHGGFIPWDDDLDIEMLEEDYKRLLQLIDCDGLPRNLVLQTKEKDPTFIYSFAKIRHTRSKIIEPNKKTMVKGFDGIFIDIFPLYKTNSSISKFAFNIGRLYYKVLERNSSSHFGLVAQKGVYYIFRKIIYPFCNQLAMLLHKGDEYGHALGAPFPYYPRYISDVFPLSKVEFEGQYFPCPNKVDNYLTYLYGDYMKMPKIESIQQHTSSVDIF